MCVFAAERIAEFVGNETLFNMGSLAHPENRVAYAAAEQPVQKSYFW